MDEKDRQEQLKDISYKLKSSSNKLKQSLPDDRQNALEFNSLARAYSHTDEILDDIEEQFQKATLLLQKVEGLYNTPFRYLFCAKLIPPSPNPTDMGLSFVISAALTVITNELALLPSISTAPDLCSDGF